MFCGPAFDRTMYDTEVCSACCGCHGQCYLVASTGRSNILIPDIRSRAPCPEVIPLQSLLRCRPDFRSAAAEANVDRRQRLFRVRVRVSLSRIHMSNLSKYLLFPTLAEYFWTKNNNIRWLSLCSNRKYLLICAHFLSRVDWFISSTWSTPSCLKLEYGYRNEARPCLVPVQALCLPRGKKSLDPTSLSSRTLEAVLYTGLVLSGHLDLQSFGVGTVNVVSRN